MQNMSKTGNHRKDSQLTCSKLTNCVKYIVNPNKKRKLEGKTIKKINENHGILKVDRGKV